MQPADPAVIKHAWDTSQLKVVLPTILLTSLVTALITEPIKVTVQNLWKRRQIRKHVLTEIAYDLNEVWLIKTIMMGSYDRSNALWIKRIVEDQLKHNAYESARTDFYLFIRIPDYDSIRTFYEQLARTKLACQQYCVEPFENVRGSLVWYDVDIAYLLAKGCINASFKARSIGWTFAPVRVLIAPKPIGVIIRSFLAKHWNGIVVTWWRRVLEDYKEDYQTIKKRSGDS